MDAVLLFAQPDGRGRQHNRDGGNKNFFEGASRHDCSSVEQKSGKETVVGLLSCSRGSLTPVASPNASPNVFLAGDRLRGSGFGAIVLRDVARAPSVETGASDPSYSGGFAACSVVSSRGLL